jgi:hypothetical protein
MKCWKGLGDFAPFLVRHMSRSDYRDHMEVALGKVRDLLGEVWAQRPMSLFSGWLRVMDPQVHVALRMLGGS